MYVITKDGKREYDHEGNLLSYKPKSDEALGTLILIGVDTSSVAGLEMALTRQQNHNLILVSPDNIPEGYILSNYYPDLNDLLKESSPFKPKIKKIDHIPDKYFKKSWSKEKFGSYMANVGKRIRNNYNRKK